MTGLRVLRHPWLVLACRLALGGLFIAAALPKLLDPPGFARALWAYRLFPAWSIHPLALVLPWFELLCGAALALGLARKAAASALAGLLCAFILALSINLARRHPVDCGCFSTRSTGHSTEERLRDMGWTILRDVGMLLLALPVLAGRPRPETP